MRELSGRKLDFRRAVQRWYGKEGRRLPWRNISNPYRILLSEVMLQQTQVDRVRIKYREFLKRFPTFRSLSIAKRSDVVRAWQGMGYNNRAVRLHELAIIVTNENGGRLPGSESELLMLPGIGRYTAAAILSSVFKEDVPVVDVNVRRVLSRTFWKMDSVSSMQSENEIRRLAEEILPRGRAYDWNQALMDLGATVCTARKPKCNACPVAGTCASRGRMNAAPQPKTKKEPSRNGIPNRIYRGRIVECLRKREGIRVEQLAELICSDFVTNDKPWLIGLLRNLERDGLVRVRGNGSLRNRVVTLR